MFGWLKRGRPTAGIDAPRGKGRKRRSRKAADDAVKKGRGAKRRSHSQKRRDGAGDKSRRNGGNSTSKGGSGRAAQRRKNQGAARRKTLSTAQPAPGPLAAIKPTSPAETPKNVAIHRPEPASLGQASAAAVKPPAAVARQAERGIAAYGFFAAPIGVGEAARRGVDALRLAGVPVSTHVSDLPNIPVKVPYPADDPAAPAYDTALVHINPGPRVLKILSPLGKVRKIAVWHWELPVFPPQWAAQAAIVDEIWAPSRYIADMIGAAMNVPIRLVPHPATIGRADRAGARERLGLPQDRRVGSSRVDLQACKLEYSIVSPK